MKRFGLTWFWIVPFYVLLLCPQNMLAQISWNIVTLETVYDTIVVDVSLPSEVTCGDLGCTYNAFETIIVSPCPLNKICTGDNYEYTYGDHKHWEYKLIKGVEYTFSGHYVFFGQWGDRPGVCNQSCKVEGFILATIYPNDYVSNANSSWGMIKALYFLK
jgi:hypothetical protein